METLSYTLVQLVFNVCELLVDGSHLLIDFFSSTLSDLFVDLANGVFIDLDPFPWLTEAVMDLVSLGLPFMEWTVLEFMFSAGLGFVVAYSLIKWLIPLLE